MNPPALPHYSYSLYRKAACKYCQTLSNVFYFPPSIYYNLDFTLATLLKLLTFPLLMSLNDAQSFSAALGIVEDSFPFDWHSHLDAKKSLFPLSFHLTACPCSLFFVGSSFIIYLLNSEGPKSLVLFSSLTVPSNIVWPFS